MVPICVSSQMNRHVQYKLANPNRRFYISKKVGKIKKSIRWEEYNSQVSDKYFMLHTRCLVWVQNGHLTIGP